VNIRNFEWDQRNEEHIGEHGIAIFEVEESMLYRKPLYVRGREGKYVCYGITEEGRYLFVVFVFKPTGLVRVITARDMTRKDKRFYKRESGG